MSRPDAPVPAPTRRRLVWPAVYGLTLAAVVILAVVLINSGPSADARPEPPATRADGEKREAEDKKEEKKPTAGDKEDAPDLDGGTAWLNTAGPVKLKDLKGKVVLLDFWTLCCINCIHVLPDLKKLEQKYPNELVVIGVHSAKFDNEKDTKSIRKAVLRYEIAHPVVNDAEHRIWNKFNVSSWPTRVLIDPEGKYFGQQPGEGNFEVFDRVIAKLIKDAKEKGTLNEKPIRFDLIRYRETGDTPLFFPGKIHADEAGKRLFIADSTHHRIVVTDLDGNKVAIVGDGTPGRKDGGFAEARFDDPQGIALIGETLYVADRRNHCIRAVDLKARSVTTVAGTGQQDSDSRVLDHPRPAAETGLNSPWDLLAVGSKLFVAMAGDHQIWLFDPEKKEIGPFAGNGRENIKDGPLYASSFAQPSGLATDGKFLYVADSEVSAIRKVPLDGNGRVTTLVGEGLFEFGDEDGVGDKARLQHALGVTFHDGKLYVADTYNSKVKVLDPATRECRTLLGGDAPKGWYTDGPPFSEPAGLAFAAGKLYVADTNSHRIRVVDLAAKKVTTLPLKGVDPPPPQKEWQPPAKEKK
jgi:DNA-binding beta-propeller fold protein YncE